MNRHARTTAACLFLICSISGASAQERFDAFEKTIPELQDALSRGKVTSVGLVRQYLARIEAFDRAGARLNSMVYVNPRAIDEAKTLDDERRTSGARGPLHGIPVILKDNYDTLDMPSTAGSVALTGFVPPDDGFQVRKLREAGAVFVGKSNMHELARGITTISSSGGQTRNPYDPERNPGGSSGGTGAAIAANFAAVGMGSDTCGSIRIPAANNNLFGLRVTQGLSSRDGILPLSHTQDVGGPIARSMIDLVLVLDATVGPDPADPQTAVAQGKVPATYTTFLEENSLQGVRLGLLQSALIDELPEKEVTDVVLDAVSRMEAHGATTVEIEIDGLDDLLEASGVIGMEFKFDLRDYLAASPGAPVRDLSEILERGLYHAALASRFRSSEESEENSDEYREALATRETLASRLAEVMDENRLDAIVYPTLRIKPARIGEPQRGTSCAISANSGLPALSVPAGFTEDGVPVGLELLGRPFTEGALIGMGYAYEQAVKPRRPPYRTPSLLAESLVTAFRAEGDGSQMRPAVSSRASFLVLADLDRASQTLRYDLQVDGLLSTEWSGLTLNRGAPGTNGEILALVGKGRFGEVPIRNQDRNDLLDGNLYLVMYTVDNPLGELRGQLRPISAAVE